MLLVAIATPAIAAETGYFVLPADKTNQSILRSELKSTNQFTVEKALAVKCQTSKDIEVENNLISKMTDVKKQEFIAQETKDVFPTFNLQSREIATLEDGRKIVHAIIPGWLEKRMKQFVLESETRKTFSKGWLIALGIDSAFIGFKVQDIIKKFPELDGMKIIGKDDDGKNILVPKIDQHKWGR